MSIARSLTIAAVACGVAIAMLPGEKVTAAVKYTLTTSVDPADTGTITPAGGTFSRNNYITITATAVAGCRFDHWGGDLSGTENPTHYRFDTAKYAVTFVAYFVSTNGGTCTPPLPPPPPDFVPARVIGYFPEWAVSHTPPYYVKHVLQSDPTRSLTTINYAFVVPGPGPDGTVVCQLDDPVAAYQQTYMADASVDGIADDPSQKLRGHFNQLRQLKSKYQNLKLVVSIGGWLGSTWFSDAAATSASRQAFVSSCLDLFVDGNLPVAGGAGGPAAALNLFDGFDLDWEYPVSGGIQGTHHNSADGTNFRQLLQEFRSQFAARGRDDGGADDLLLTMAGPAANSTAQNYQMSQAHPYLDYVMIMTYDFHGSWERTTGHHSNLCTSPDDPSSDTWKLSLDRSVSLYRDSYGVPAAKIVPGGAYYARGWKGVRTSGNGLYQRAAGAAPGKYEAGAEYYRDLPVDSDGLLGINGFTRYWDTKARAPWLFNPSTGVLWSYDDAQSVALKGEYVRFNRLGGLMFWELSGDDTAGTLFDAMRTALTSFPTSDPCTR